MIGRHRITFTNTPTLSHTSSRKYTPPHPDPEASKTTNTHAAHIRTHAKKKNATIIIVTSRLVRTTDQIDIIICTKPRAGARSALGALGAVAIVVACHCVRRLVCACDVAQ